MTRPPVAVYGSGGMAREVAWLAEECGHPVVCFIDDDPSRTGRIMNGLPVLAIDEVIGRFKDAHVAAAIGNPASRERVATRIGDHGLEAVSLVHPRVEKSRWITLGAGVVICAGSVLTTNISVGNFVQINLDCTIGHDVVLADFATLAPGVHVSGNVTIGTRAYVGTGAVIINGTPEQPLIIGEASIVGAGACVTRSVEPGVTVAGVPARPLARR